MEVEKKKKKDKKRDVAPVTDPSSPSPAAASSSTDVDAESAEAAQSTVGLSVIAHPLAGRKLTKKLLRLVKKASKTKSLRRGVKEVVKAIRKGEKGSAQQRRRPLPRRYARFTRSPADVRLYCVLCVWWSG